MGIPGLTLFAGVAGAGGSASTVDRIISATVGALMVVLCFVFGAFFLVRGFSGP